MRYTVIALALLGTALLYQYFILPLITKKYLSVLIEDEPTDSPSLISKVLRSFLPSRCVLTSISLPIPGRDGEEIAYGNVAVNRAGIFIISRICGNGLIENPPRGDKWRFMSCGSVKEFTNPFKAQDAPRRLLAMYAGSAGVKNVRVHTLVVYTDNELRFSSPPSKGVMHVSEMYKKMKRLSSKGNLDYKSIRAITSALKDANDGVLILPAMNEVSPR